MGRIRTIKPEFWVSEQVVECSPNARLLFIGMWNFCDDGGNHPASPKSLKMQVFPGDDFTVTYISDLIDELKNQGLIAEYTGNDGKNYWHVTGWHHQKIDRPSFKYPKFDERSSNDRRTPPPGKDSKGKDSKGGDEEKNAHAKKPESDTDLNAKKNTPPIPAAPPTPPPSRLDEWIESLTTDFQVKDGFCLGYKIPQALFAEYVQRFPAVARAAPEKYNRRSDLTGHFLNWSATQYAKHKDGPAANGKPPQRATIMHYQNGRPALKEKQKF